MDPQTVAWTWPYVFHQNDEPRDGNHHSQWVLSDAVSIRF